MCIEKLISNTEQGMMKAEEFIIRNSLFSIHYLKKHIEMIISKQLLDKIVQ